MSVNLAIDRVAAALSAGDPRRFADAARDFLAEFRAATAGDEFDLTSRMLAFEVALRADGRIARADAVAAIRDVVESAVGKIDDDPPPLGASG
jgi:hypothetical protein